MPGPSTSASRGLFRIFGTPYSTSLHQYAVCLHLRRLPTKMYCRDILSTLFFGAYHKAQGLNSCIAPERQGVFLSQNALLDFLEAHVPDSPDHPTLAINPKTHPNTCVMANAINVYSGTWLLKTGTGYRFVHEPPSAAVLGFVAWVGGFLLPSSIICNLKPLRRYVRNLAMRVLESHGMSRGAMPYHELHFKRLCESLESHFHAHPGHSYVLLTSRPSLADVGFGTAFSSYFLMDDAPLELLHELFPLTLAYAMRCSCQSDKKGRPLAAAKDAAGEPLRATDFPGDRDVVVPSLLPVIELMKEVLPWTVAQAESFRRHMAKVEQHAGSPTTTTDVDAAAAAPSLPNGYVMLKGGPMQGVAVYPIPYSRSTIQYWVLVDKELQSCVARGADLEVATRAGRNIMQVWEAGVTTTGAHNSERPALLPPAAAETSTREDAELLATQAVQAQISKGAAHASPPAEKSGTLQQRSAGAEDVSSTSSLAAAAASGGAQAVATSPEEDDDSEALHPIATRDFSMHYQTSAHSNASLQAFRGRADPALLPSKSRRKVPSPSEEQQLMHDNIEHLLTLLARMHVPEYVLVMPMDPNFPRVIVAAVPVRVDPVTQ